ncbi:MAG: hypothetical protein N3A38_06705 [Planctomycetota bacterium]|nr:hypothetical protein [Planctomycetota bacterium]
MKKSIVLTPAQSKRLIAKGVAARPDVLRAKEKGMLIVCTGTTNAYVVEEITGERIEKTKYVTGHYRDRTRHQDVRMSSELPTVVYKGGKRADGVPVADAVKEMGPGDVVLKGANALNYERRQVAVMIGHPQGGTLASVLGCCVARRIHLIHPVGLEKSVPVDLDWAARHMRDDFEGPALWPSPGEIFTEIEAIAVLTGAKAYPVAAGGILGAEGCVVLLCEGSEEQIAAVARIRAALEGEPPFGLP